MVTTAATLGATSAHAGVHLAVGVNLPVPVFGVAAAPVYGTGYYAPAPVYAAPAPVYVAPRVVYAAPYVAPYAVGYYPRPVYYRPAPYGYVRYGYRGGYHGWR